MSERPLLRFFLPFALLAATTSAQADNTQTWSRIGEIGGPLLWAAGLGSSMFQDGRFGLAHTARTVDGFIATAAATELLKNLTRERRPSGSQLDSFPSGHASLSFEVAAAQSFYHPRQAPFWYGAASLVSYARVAGNQHHVQDVIAGAALGFGLGHLSVSSRHGWLIAPIVERKGTGLSIMFSG